MSEFDEFGFEAPRPTSDCEYGPRSLLPCAGPAQTQYSRSGLTSSVYCERHWGEHNDILDGIAERYPDSDVAPAWFDPTYAGESWNDDY